MRESLQAALAAALLLPLTAAAPIPAAEEAPAAQAPAAPPQQQVPRHFLAGQAEDQVLASAIMGIEVAGPEGENIGTVDDLLVDRDGRLAAVIVGIGGFLGIGQKDVAIPVEALTFDLETDPAVVEPAAGAAEPHEDRSAVWNWGASENLRRIVVDFTRAELDHAPDFTRLDD
jgi:sporulation protein YlmC with PRC-barrel domain